MPGRPGVIRAQARGTAVLASPPESASRLVSVVIGAEDAPLDQGSLRVAAMQEIGHIVPNRGMGSIGTILGGGFSPVRTRFKIENPAVGGDEVVSFRLDSFEVLVQTRGRRMAGRGAFFPVDVHFCDSILYISPLFFHLCKCALVRFGAVPGLVPRNPGILCFGPILDKKSARRAWNSPFLDVIPPLRGWTSPSGPEILRPDGGSRTPRAAGPTGSRVIPHRRK